MAAPSRRTFLVLSVLVAAMTTAGALLVATEPGPVSPFQPLSLSAMDRPGAGLFDTAAAPDGGWTHIGIHFSGAAHGSPESLAQLHRRHGLPDLGFHFVIGNGQGASDGQLHISGPWRRQQPGLTTHTQGGSGVIDIGLVGDGQRQPPTQAQMAQLVELVQQLQQRLNIPADRVLLYTDPQTGRGRLFPVAWFRQQLLVR